MDFSVLVGPVSVVWACFEILLVRLKHSDQTSSSRDNNSIRILWLAIFLSVTAGVVVRISGIGNLSFASSPMSVVGLTLIVAGLVVRGVAVLNLRKYFTVDVAILRDHAIVNTGLYRYLRHPAYAGLLLSFTGLAITFANWLSLLVIVVPITWVFSYRIRVEERALTEHFGDSYRTYCSSTYRLIPWIY